MVELEAPFGELLRRHRVAANMTQEALAERSGMSLEAIVMLERGMRPFPRRSTVALLVDALGLAPDDRGALVAAQRRLTSRGGAPRAADEADAAPEPTWPRAGSRLQAARNPLFVGRARELRWLADSLTGDGTDVVAVTGMGGAGKTQLAVEFAHRFGRQFSGGVFWLDLTTPDATPAQVAACGGPAFMDLCPDFAALPLEHRLALVARAWQGDEPRLLVFDGCEDEALLARWRPCSGGCRVLVTARRPTWDRTLGVDVLALDVLPRPDSVELLHRLRPGPDAGEAALDAIAHELGDLPLALHLAGSFLDRYRSEVGPDDYLAQARRPDLLEHASLAGQGLIDPTSPTRRLAGVAPTFASSCAQLDPADRVDRTALTLMERAARLDPGVPATREGLLQALGETGAPDERLVRADALRRLADLGLVEVSCDGVRQHPLLARFVRSGGGRAVARAARRSSGPWPFRESSLTAER
jgi:transcriptional regulator with XRE-family HTH domain